MVLNVWPLERSVVLFEQRSVVLFERSHIVVVGFGEELSVALPTVGIESLFAF